MEPRELEAQINRIEVAVIDSGGSHVDWKAIWKQIGETGKAFKETLYPSRDDKNAAWDRYQLAVVAVRERQTAHFEEKSARRDFFKRSESHMYKIMSLADGAKPPSGLEDVILMLATGGLYGIAKVALDAMFGESDVEKRRLQQRSAALKEANAYFSENKAEMVGQHKQQAFRYIQPIRERLQSDWEAWQQHRDEIYAERKRQHEERHAAWEERQEKRRAWEARREEWRAKQEGFIEAQGERIDRLENALDRKRDHLRDLEDKRAGAWNDDFRDRVDGWIDECESAIRDIEEKLDIARAKRDDAQRRLNESD